MLLCVTMDFNALEKSKRNMVLILYSFYICFVKTNLTVTGGFQVFDFALFYILFYDFGARSISLILYCFYKGFAKTNLGAFGGFQVCDLVLIKTCVLMMSVPWSGQTTRFH